MKKQLIQFQQFEYEQAKEKYSKHKEVFNELLAEANKLIKVKDIEQFEKNPQGYFENAYLDKFPELKNSQVTFKGLISMQEKDLSKFNKAVANYKAISYDKKEPIREDYELYTKNDKQAELTHDLKEIVKQFNNLHTKYGLTIHKGTFFQAVPQAFYGFELEPNPTFVLTF